ncbi:hypothetical protein FACS189425_06010 [Clostridia bacterium]|nr:hypothetical protein FACS189425_06010 [Clostridia bacterium]
MTENKEIFHIPLAEVRASRNTGEKGVLKMDTTLDVVTEIDVAYEGLSEIIHVASKQMEATNDVAVKKSLSAQIEIMQAERRGFYSLDNEALKILVNKIQSFYAPKVRAYWATKRESADIKR